MSEYKKWGALNSADIGSLNEWVPRDGPPKHVSPARKLQILQSGIPAKEYQLQVQTQIQSTWAELAEKVDFSFQCAFPSPDTIQSGLPRQ